jgi:site-specific DNA-methyltransferase (adenine-specific)
MLNDVCGDKGGRIVEDIENDNISEEELYGILVKAFTNLREISKEDASYYVTSPQGGSLGLMMMMMRDAGLTVRHMLIWVKNVATFSMRRLDYDYQHEPIFYTWTKSHHYYGKGEIKTTVWNFDKPHKCDLHPTMKPVALIAEAIVNSTKEGDVVTDIFGGSGSTMIACEQLNRRCYMMEKDPHYVDVILSRWEQLTGRKAELVSG